VARLVKARARSETIVDNPDLSAAEKQRQLIRCVVLLNRILFCFWKLFLLRYVLISLFVEEECHRICKHIIITNCIHIINSFYFKYLQCTQACTTW
jgi:hypothetical protein